MYYVNKLYKKFYYFVWIPLSAIWFYAALAFLSFLLLVTLTLSFSLNIVFSSPIFKAYPESLYAIETWRPKDNTKIYDKDKKLISEQFNKYHVYLPYEKIPQKMIDAIVSIEDKKFWQHKGIDVFAILRAFTSLLSHPQQGIKQGASTITQQVIKNLVLSNKRTISRKIREIVLSLYLETFMDKKKILEIYCNSIFLGHGSYGVAAAAKRYFGKDVSRLDYHETALIAGLFQSPGRYNPTLNPKAAKQRQLIVLQAMVQAKVLDRKALKKYENMPLNYDEYKSTYGKIAPYFVDYVIEKTQEILEDKNIDIKGSGLQIFTTLDSNLDSHGSAVIENSQDIYEKMSRSLLDHSQSDHSHNVEASLIAIDRKSGGIVTMIGGRDYNKNKFNRAAQALRAPGSSFKTFVYALALEKGMEWNKQFYVSPVTIGNYRPKTSYSQLFSETTLFESFYKSINSTAVLVGQKIGINSLVNFSKKLNIKTPLKEEAATFLGGSEVSMLDMARAYLSMATNGRKQQVHAISKIVDRDGKVLYEKKQSDKKVFPPLKEQTYELIKEGLKSVVRYGTGYKARHLSGLVAGKTGTTDQARDNWFCGYTKDLIIITWLGNDNNVGFKGDISASNTATPLFSRFAKRSIKVLNSGRLNEPYHLEMAKVHPRYGIRDHQLGVPMYFRKGHAPIKNESDLKLLEEGKELRIGMNEL